MSANRIIDVSNPAYLRTAKRQLIIEQESQVAATIPIEDLEVILLSHPQITASIGLMQQCLESKVPIIVCDQKHMPKGYLFNPLANTLHSKVLKLQVGASLPLKKQIWATLVRAKITGQSYVLSAKDRPDGGLSQLVNRVKSGDLENIEAQAAARYWRLLFGSEFRRNPDLDGINALLNYGYAIVRAATARSLAAAGLNPSIGLFHHNQYNHFCLADDLMEPSRPLVDAAVFELTRDQIPSVDHCTKKALLAILQQEVLYDEKTYYLTDALHRTAASVAQALESGKSKTFKCLSVSS